MVNQLKNHPNQRAEEALEAVLEKKKITLTEHEFVVTLHKSLEAVRTVTFYIREKIIKTLIESGINVDVLVIRGKNLRMQIIKILLFMMILILKKGLTLWHKAVFLLMLCHGIKAA